MHEHRIAITGTTPSNPFSGQMYPQGTAGNLPPSKQEQTVITIQTPANGIVTFSTEAPIVIEPDGTIRSLQHR